MKYVNIILLFLLLPVATFATLAPITGTTTLCQFSLTALTDATPGGTWSSSITTVAVIDTNGIVSGVAAGTSTITYTDGITSEFATVTVNPSPVLTSTLTPGPICDSAIFNYAPVCSMVDTNLNWARPFVTGIEDPAGTGKGNPDEQLINTTYLPLTVNYVYTLSSGGCINTATVSVVVNPTPRLSSALSNHVCTGTAFNYIPAYATPGTTATWARPAVANITPATSSGSGVISETLTNASSLPITVNYAFMMRANGCSNSGAQLVAVNVSPCNEGVPQLNAPESSIYPNPGHGMLTAYFPSDNDERMALTITNVLGEKVKELFIITNTSTDIRVDIPSGIYFLSAVSEHSRYYGKLVVDR